MRSNRFRFPWSGIGLMTLILGMVVVAIHNARDLSQKFAGTTVFQGKTYSYQPEQISLLHTFAFAFAVTFVCTVVIWAVLHRMHRSGVHRLSDAQTWPQ